MNIEVTAEDIRRGTRNSNYMDVNACPVARAVKRASKSKNVSVMPGTITVDNHEYRLPLGSTAHRFIVDATLRRFYALEPFSFSLED